MAVRRSFAEADPGDGMDTVHHDAWTPCIMMGTVVVPTFRSAQHSMNHTEQLKALDDARWRIAIALTIAMMVLYFGFILLVAYAKPLLGRLVVPGLSLGILLGALVIVAAWVLIWIYVRWANTHYDAAIDALRGRP